MVIFFAATDWIVHKSKNGIVTQLCSISMARRDANLRLLKCRLGFGASSCTDESVIMSPLQSIE